MKKKLNSLRLSALCLSALLALSGCGATAAGETTSQAGSAAVSSSAATQATAATPEQTGETRTVSTVMGDVEVPTDPQRVIITYGTGDLVAMGVRPVAVFGVEGTAYEDEVADIPELTAFEPEAIMVHDPDLIIAVNEEQYEIGAQIAPTVLLPFTELSMQERMTFLGEVLNKQEEAKACYDNFAAKVDSAKAELSTMNIMDKTISLFEASGKGTVWVYGDKWGRGGDLVYSQLGFAAPEIVQNEIIAKDQYRELSMEVLNEYAGDYILFSGELGDLAENPVWNAIPAVAQGHVIPIDFDLFYNIDIYSSAVQLDYLMEQFRQISA